MNNSTTSTCSVSSDAVSRSSPVSIYCYTVYQKKMPRLCQFLSASRPLSKSASPQTIPGTRLNKQTRILPMQEPSNSAKRIGILLGPLGPVKCEASQLELDDFSLLIQLGPQLKQIVDVLWHYRVLARAEAAAHCEACWGLFENGKMVCEDCACMV